MEEWLESVYSDGSSDFVSNPAPALGETVQIRLRCYADLTLFFINCLSHQASP